MKQDQADKADSEEGRDGQEEFLLGGQEETVIDALIGNLKNEVTSTTASDGSKNISLQLQSAQIPAVV